MSQVTNLRFMPVSPVADVIDQLGSHVYEEVPCSRTRLVCSYTLVVGFSTADNPCKIRQRSTRYAERSLDQLGLRDGQVQSWQPVRLLAEAGS